MADFLGGGLNIRTSSKIGSNDPGFLRNFAVAELENLAGKDQLFAQFQKSKDIKKVFDQAEEEMKDNREREEALIGLSKKLTANSFFSEARTLS